MFSVRKVPLSSTAYTLLKYFNVRHPQGLLDIVWKTRQQEAAPNESIIKHITQKQDTIAAFMPIVQEHMQPAYHRHTSHMITLFCSGGIM